MDRFRVALARSGSRVGLPGGESSASDVSMLSG